MVVRTMDSFTDADFRRTMWSALRLLAVITVVAAPLVWWKMGWQSRGAAAGGCGDLGVGIVGVAAPDDGGDGADG